ncbi:hypothetical protein OG21DRAFT_1517113 [Imleria badia]|nr:hypothetical protein OG21DRAFT_1517113 [Imleria badia]
MRKEVDNGKDEEDNRVCHRSGEDRPIPLCAFAHSATISSSPRTPTETPIRIQAAVALSKLCGSEGPPDVEDDQQTTIDILLNALSWDPAAKV